ncbi:MAG: hypothetical protein H6816_11405 [Phycisphaerales bacterium]|nr:hypothetical protein [Phycisphaerales bacterium]
MARFDPPRLTALLQDDPGGVVEGILRGNSRGMTSDELAAALAAVHSGQGGASGGRGPLGPALNRHVQIEGRLPYYLKYDPTHLTLDGNRRRLARP